MIELITLFRLLKEFFFREINTEEGINFENFIEELRLVSMSNELFRDGYCESSRSNSANTFHDEGMLSHININ